tara:strand:+ start:199 stop:951 length:753 start_codon:yes stop_codon:yes gene_type:complete
MPFIYKKLVKKLCYDYVDKDSLSIIEKFSVFYTNDVFVHTFLADHDNSKILMFLNKYIIENYDLNFLNFLIFNIKSQDIFDLSKKNISKHFRRNQYIDFNKIENEIYNGFKSQFNTCNHKRDIKSFIKKYFWSRILTDDNYTFLQNSKRWEYIENSMIFIENILIDKLKISHSEFSNFIDFVKTQFDFTNFYIKDYNLNFEDNLVILNLDFGYTEDISDFLHGTHVIYENYTHVHNVVQNFGSLVRNFIN